MFGINRDTLSGLRSRFTESAKKVRVKDVIDKASSVGASSLSGTDGKVFRLLSWALPAAFGLTAGWFGTACLEVWLDGVNGSSRPYVAEASLTSAAQKSDRDNMTVFLRTNPFKISPMVPDAPKEPEVVEEAPQTSGLLTEAVLKGTSPGYIAWIEAQGKLTPVTVGNTFDFYTLEDVTYRNATFVKDGERIVKEIVYGTKPPAPSQAQASPEPAVVAAAPAPGQVSPPNPASGTPGVINRDTVNQLLENPFDELRKVRIGSTKNGQGLQVEWIKRDSILFQLGVKKNDVVSAVNGITFRNAMDISNSLTSLMASDQFVVEVVRNGEPTTLQYEVR